MKLPSMPRWQMPAVEFIGWRSLLLGTALFCLAFVVGFLLALPMAPLQQRLVDSFGAYQTSAELKELSLSPRLALQGRQLTLRLNDSQLPPLTIEHFHLRPAWLSLLSANPGARAEAELLQGTVQATLYKGGQLQAEARGLQFSIPFGDGAATLVGTLAAGQLQRGAGDGKAAETTVALTFSDLQATSPLLAGTASRPLALGETILEGSGRGQVLSITRLAANGGDLSLAGTGNVLLGRSPDNSRLNLTLTLRPTATFPAEMRTLLELLGPPGGDGSYLLKIGGTLAMPLLQSPGDSRLAVPMPAPAAREAVPAGTGGVTATPINEQNQAPAPMTGHASGEDEE